LEIYLPFAAFTLRVSNNRDVRQKAVGTADMVGEGSTENAFEWPTRLRQQFAGNCCLVGNSTANAAFGRLYFL